MFQNTALSLFISCFREYCVCSKIYRILHNRPATFIYFCVFDNASELFLQKYSMICTDTHLTIIELVILPSGRVAGRVCGNRLLQRMMSPSPKSQVMFASAFSRIGDFFSYFGIHTFYLTANFFNI